jgi:hypothetical protein
MFPSAVRANVAKSTVILRDMAIVLGMEILAAAAVMI